MPTDIFYLSGVAGMVAMVFAQLYSVRKRLRFPGFIKIKKLLEIHVALGILGPFFVIIHTKLNFYGIAGISAFLMIVVVLSGFVGRHIYVRIPKNEEKMKKLLAKWRSLHIPLTMLFFATASMHIFAIYYY